MNIDAITALFGIDAVLAVALTTALVQLFGTNTGKKIEELAAGYMEIRTKLESYVEMGKDGFDASEIKQIRESLQKLLNSES